MSKYKKVNNERITKFFYIILIMSIFIFALSIPLTNASSLKLYLWKPGSSFYDFYSCLKDNVYWNRTDLYLNNPTIYPPLANFIYMLITRCMSIQTVKELEVFESLKYVKSLQECSLYFVIYMNVLLIGYYLVCTSLKKGSKNERVVFSILTLFTVPFIYQFERANIIFLSLIFSMCFFLWYDCENKYMRELSYIALAFAAGIKIYPAIYGVLVIKKGRYKDALRLIIYGILLFILPFAVYGNIGDNLLAFVENLTNTSEGFNMTRIGCQLDFESISKYLFYFLGDKRIFVSRIITTFLAFSGIVGVLVLDDGWKNVLLMTCLLIGIPGISYTYTAIFMVIPVIIYLDSKEKSAKDIIYGLGMLLVIIPLPFCWLEGRGDVYYSYMNVTTPMLIESISLLLMTSLLVAEAFLKIFNKLRHVSSACLLIMIVMSILVNKSSYDIPYSYTEYLTKTLSDKVVVKKSDILSQSFIANEDKLEYIVLKFNSLDSGKIEFTVKKKSNNTIMANSIYDFSELESGYNTIEFENCILIPDEEYVLEIRLIEIQEDGKIAIWKTVDTIESGTDIFRINGEIQKGCLGVQFYEQ